MRVNISHRTWAFLVIATIVAVADQFTKFLVKSFIQLGGSWPETGIFRITHHRNTGAAFSLFPDSRILLSIISSIGIMLLLYTALIFSRRFAFLRWKSSVVSLGLMLGGTVGNWIGRVFVGYVTDFISVWKWPNFNVADSSLVIGCILLAMNLFRSSEMERSSEPNSAADCR